MTLDEKLQAFANQQIDALIKKSESAISNKPVYSEKEKSIYKKLSSKGTSGTITIFLNNRDIVRGYISTFNDRSITMNPMDMDVSTLTIFYTDIISIS